MTSPPRVDADLEAIVLADLEYLASSWGDISEASVKRESAALRKLLLDNGGTLQKYRKQKGFRGEPVIRTTRLENAIAPPWENVIIGMAGGAWINGFYFDIAEYRDLKEGEDFPPRTGSERELFEFALSRYLATACIVVAGKPLNRIDCIKYVANKLGGVHYDPRRNPKHRESVVYTLLDKNRNSLGISGLDAVHFQIVATGQAILRSPDVASLLPAGFTIPVQELPPPYAP